MEAADESKRQDGKPVAIAPRHILKKVLDLYARKGWVRLPFHRADIEADPAFSRMEISQ